MVEVVQEFHGDRMSTRVVKALGLDGELGFFNVMYEYSKAKNVWQFHCWNGYRGREGRRAYDTIAKARGAARACLKQNN